MTAHRRTAQIAATNTATIRRVLLEVARRRREEARRIGARIAELREQHHLTQQAAAERMGVAYRTYQTWEAGDATPRWHNFQKIAKTYHTTVDQILGNNEIAKTSDSLEQRMLGLEKEVSRQAQVLESLVEALRISPQSETTKTEPAPDRETATVAGAGARLLEKAASQKPRAPGRSTSPAAAQRRKRA